MKFDGDSSPNRRQNFDFNAVRSPNWRIKLAKWLVRALLGTQSHLRLVSDTKASVAGIIALWYVEDGSRRFVLLKQKSGKKNQPARFISFVDLVGNESAAEAANSAVKSQLGEHLHRSLQRNIIAEDTVMAAPTLHAADEEGDVIPVQCLVWGVQITAEQAELCVAANEKYEVITLNEAHLLSNALEEAHRYIYEGIMNKIAARGRLMFDAEKELISRLFDEAGVTQNRVLN